jgi:hypothetical protein
MSRKTSDDDKSERYSNEQSRLKENGLIADRLDKLQFRTDILYREYQRKEEDKLI